MQVVRDALHVNRRSKHFGLCRGVVGLSDDDSHPAIGEVGDEGVRGDGVFRPPAVSALAGDELQMTVGPPGRRIDDFSEVCRTADGWPLMLCAACEVSASRRRDRFDRVVEENHAQPGIGEEPCGSANPCRDLFVGVGRESVNAECFAERVDDRDGRRSARERVAERGLGGPVPLLVRLDVDEVFGNRLVADSHLAHATDVGGRVILVVDEDCVVSAHHLLYDHPQADPGLSAARVAEDGVDLARIEQAENRAVCF